MPLKLSRTVWVYCSCVGADCPCRVSSQKVAVTETAVAFGPSAPPFRKAVFAVPALSQLAAALAGYLQARCLRRYPQQTSEGSVFGPPQHWVGCAAVSSSAWTAYQRL